MVVGQIINLYRDPADRLAEYCQGDLIAPKEDEYPKKEEQSEGTEKKKLNWFKKFLLKIHILEE